MTFFGPFLRGEALTIADPPLNFSSTLPYRRCRRYSAVLVRYSLSPPETFSDRLCLTPAMHHTQLWTHHGREEAMKAPRVRYSYSYKYLQLLIMLKYHTPYCLPPNKSYYGTALFSPPPPPRKKKKTPYPYQHSAVRCSRTSKC